MNVKEGKGCSGRFRGPKMLREGSRDIQEEAHDIWEEPSMWRLPSCDIREGFDGREAPGD